ncbi:MAG: hypothetical protein JW941_08895 [Candidatus Coatesbacteria bacterium]|nr:hypothetical protein [Candidatus Coatesbacteria bacterium]
MSSRDRDSITAPLQPSVLEPKLLVPIDPNLKPPVEQVSGFAMDDRGNFYIADSSQHRIVKLSASGGLIWAIGSNGKGEDEFQYPRGIAVSEENNLLIVCDSWNNRVVALDLEGNPKFTFGEVGYGAGQFYEPYAVCMTSADEVIVVDRGNHRLQRFSIDGNFKAMIGRRGSVIEQALATLHGTPNYLFAPPCFRFPSGIAPLSPTGIAVLDAGNRRVLAFSNQLELVSEYSYESAANGSLFTPSAIAANDVGFVFLFDSERGLVQQMTVPGLVIATFGLLDDSKKSCYQPQLLATAGGLVAARIPSNELAFFGLGQSSLREAILAKKNTEASPAAAESLIAHGVQQNDAGLISEGISCVLSGESAPFRSVKAAAEGLIALKQPLNLYLLLSRAVHASNVERDDMEREIIDLFRDLEKKISASAKETAACEAASMADDSSPHSVSEADILRDYREALIKLKLLMAKDQAQSRELVKLVWDAALLYRKRELWEGFDYCLGVVLQVAFKESEALCETLLGTRNRLGEMVGLCKKVMSDSSDQQASERFIYLGRYRAVPNASRGQHLGVLSIAVDCLHSILSERSESSASSSGLLERTDEAELAFASKLLEKALSVCVAGASDGDIAAVAGKLIWLLLRSYPGLRRMNKQADVLKRLGLDESAASVGAQELERFIYLYIFEKAVAGEELIGGSVFGEAASVAWGETHILAVLKSISSGSEEHHLDDSRANTPLNAVKLVMDSIAKHGESWARVILESYMRLAGLRASPRAIANKSLMDLLAHRQKDAYDTIFAAHRMSLQGSSQLLKLLAAGIIASRNEKLVMVTGKELSTTRLVELLEKLATSVCLPLADKSGKPMLDDASLMNIGQRKEVLHFVANSLNEVRTLFAEVRFHFALASTDFGAQFNEAGERNFNRDTADILITVSENYVRSQRGLREWLWSRWSKETLGSRDAVLDPKMLGDTVAAGVLVADRSLRLGLLLKALSWSSAEFVRLRAELSAALPENELAREERDRGLTTKIRLPKKVLKATYHLYCDPSTRAAAREFWGHMNCDLIDSEASGIRSRLAAAVSSIHPRVKASATRPGQGEENASSNQFLDAMADWVVATTARSTEFIRMRSKQLDSSGQSFRIRPFIDGQRDLETDLNFVSCHEAILTTVSLAASSGIDWASISNWNPQALRAALDELLAGAISSKAPDNLSDWAKNAMARVFDLCRVYLGQIRTFQEFTYALSDGTEINLQSEITLSLPDVSDDAHLTGLLPPIMLENHALQMRIADLADTARRIGCCVLERDGQLSECFSWMDALQVNLEVILRKLDGARQVIWQRQKDTQERISQATSSKRWPPLVNSLILDTVSSMLSEMADAASGLRSRLADLKGNLIAAVSSSGATPEDMDRFFFEAERLLKKDPGRRDILEALSRTMLDESSDASSVKRAVLLRSRYDLRLIDRRKIGLSQPYSITSDGAGRLLIADFGNRRIGRYDRADDFFEILAAPSVPGRSGSFVGPFGLATWGDSTLCSFQEGDVILQFDGKFNVIRELGPRIFGESISKVCGLAADKANARLAIADFGSDRVLLAFLDDGQELKPDKYLPFEGPVGVAFRSDGAIAVSSYSTGIVGIFDKRVEQMTTLTGFAMPHMLAFGADGSLFVADARNDCIKRFSPELDLVYSIPTKAPSGICLIGDELLATSVDTGELSRWKLMDEI